MSLTEEKLWRKPRPIVERIIIEGDLVLQSPAHFGSGDEEPFSQVDMSLLRDPLESRALLPGASIAGALRNYLREVELGYRAKETKGSLAVALFGLSKGATEGVQSSLLVHDALASTSAYVELRDGVRIDPKTRTAAEGAKFDLEVVAAGTVFPLCFELVIEEELKDTLLKALALTLQGLEQSQIHLGARKQRGLGRVKVEQWQVWHYDLTAPAGLLGWLAAEQPDIAPAPAPQVGTNIAALLGVNLEAEHDGRHAFNLTATFALDGSLLIRSNFDYASNGPDTVHLQGRQADGQVAPLIPGSSLAGVIRHRAVTIAQTLEIATAAGLVNEMFGYAEGEKLFASRVRVRETVIQNTRSLVQNRIRNDRFTGGAHATALFNEQPVFGGADAILTLDVTLINPKPAEIGLLLLVLKDLWVGDLPVGGESSIGRGQLQGHSAHLTLQDPQQEKSQEWTISQAAQELKIEGDKAALETFVEALKQKRGAA